MACDGRFPWVRAGTPQQGALVSEAWPGKIFGSSLFRGITANNKEYIKFFSY